MTWPDYFYIKRGINKTTKVNSFVKDLLGVYSSYGDSIVGVG